MAMPHEMAGGCSPMPRKDSVASTAMKTPRLIVETTITGASALGRMCDRMIRHGLGPERPSRLHVVVRLDLQDAGAHQPRDAGPAEDATARARPCRRPREGVSLVGERVQEQDAAEQQRDREEDVGDTPDHESSQPPK